MKKIIVGLIVFYVIASVYTLPVQAVENGDNLILTVNKNMQVSIEAKACILMDANTGTVLMANNENEQYYPASVTKIMTLILVFEAIENGKLTEDMEIICSESAAAKGGSQIWLEPGEVMTVNDLLKATVVYSANDACCLLGECVAGDEAAFVKLMNEKAKELGMNNTVFLNCTGLDDDITDHKTTAYDIALMSRQLLKYDKIREYTKIWMDTLRDGETQIVNTNKLMRNYSGATGLKTGTTTKAGCCISATAERDGMELIAVVLGSPDSKSRFSAATKLLDWGFSNYEIYSPETTDKYPETIKINFGVKDELLLTDTGVSDILINKGNSTKITTEFNVPEEIEAPIIKGQIIGQLMFKANDSVVGVCDIIASESVQRINFFSAITLLYNSLKK